MAAAPAVAPVLSTPDTHILTETEPVNGYQTPSPLSDEQLFIRYEINRTVEEIRHHRWRRIALQFPDHMLPHSPRVYEALSRELSRKIDHESSLSRPTEALLETRRDSLSLQDGVPLVKLTILADTSYGSCCVDEIAAEHVEAEAVVHYGRACLSPTARLPVVHVFTEMDLNQKACVDAFIEAFPGRSTKVILTGDMPYSPHFKSIAHALQEAGHRCVFATDTVHDPSALIPNRTLPPDVKDLSELAEWHLFHVAEPPTSLLLTLSSRLKSVRIYNPVVSDAGYGDKAAAHEAKTSILLSRRYGLVTSMASVSTWGILINTLSVKNYLSVVERVKMQIAEAGKKSYLFVVGKLNAAKVANFSEIEGWVVIGCWESSLIDSRDFFKPILTPFELSLALTSDDRRVWTGAWRSDFDQILDEQRQDVEDEQQEEENDESTEAENFDSDEESAPPEFDLRTGRYVVQARPVSTRIKPTAQGKRNKDSMALTKRANGDVLAVNGVASPAAAFLNDKRTWKGLGSDFEVKYDEDDQEGALIEEGRTGVARGYRVGDSLRM